MTELSPEVREAVEFMLALDDEKGTFDEGGGYMCGYSEETPEWAAYKLVIKTALIRGAEAERKLAEMGNPISEQKQALTSVQRHPMQGLEGMSDE